MSLDLALLLVGLTGLGIAVWSQVRALDAGEAEFRRRRKRSGIALGGLVLLLGAGVFVSSGVPADWLLAEKEDGGWGGVSIDGRPVSAADYRISVKRGRITGGRDGCNDWHYTDDPPAPDGGRMIFSTLVACPEDDPLRRAYYRLRAEGVPQLRPDGSLRLAAGGHEALFRRCRWLREPGSGMRVCALE